MLGWDSRGRLWIIDCSRREFRRACENTTASGGPGDRRFLKLRGRPGLVPLPAAHDLRRFGIGVNQCYTDDSRVQSTPLSLLRGPRRLA